jgi:hypothetical protein
MFRQQYRIVAIPQNDAFGGDFSVDRSEAETDPGKRQLQQAESEWEAVVVDVTEVAIERPKKSSEPTTVVSTNATRSKLNS